MSFIDTSKLPVIERKPGWYGRYFDSANMTFGHYEFDAGRRRSRRIPTSRKKSGMSLKASWKLRSRDKTERAGPGFVAIVPPDTKHEVKSAYRRQGDRGRLSAAEDELNRQSYDCAQST